jgi:transposase
VIAWHLLANDCDDHDLGGDWCTRHSDTDRHKTRLVKQLQALGYSVTLQPAA